MSNILFSFGDGASGGVSECVDTRDIINCFLLTWIFDGAASAVDICDLCRSLAPSVAEDIAIDCGICVDTNSVDDVTRFRSSPLRSPPLPLVTVNGTVLSMWFEVAFDWCCWSWCCSEFVKYLLPWNCDGDHGCVIDSMIPRIVGTGDDMIATSGMIASSISSTTMRWITNKNLHVETHLLILRNDFKWVDKTEKMWFDRIGWGRNYMRIQRI